MIFFAVEVMLFIQVFHLRSKVKETPRVFFLCDKFERVILKNVNVFDDLFVSSY